MVGAEGDEVRLAGLGARDGLRPEGASCGGRGAVLSTAGQEIGRYEKAENCGFRFVWMDGGDPASRRAPRRRFAFADADRKFLTRVIQKKSRTFVSQIKKHLFPRIKTTAPKTLPGGEGGIVVRWNIGLGKGIGV